MSCIQAIARNCRNESRRCQGRSSSGQHRKSQSTDAANSDGPVRSSGEGAVMALEQRDRGKGLHTRATVSIEQEEA